MKIAYIFDQIYPYEIGGVQKRIWDMSKRLAQKGHDITIVGMKYWEGDDIIYTDGVRLWGVCPPKPLFAGNRRSITQPIYFALKLILPLLKEKFDIIDCQNFPFFPAFPSKLHSLLRKSRLIITWHEVWNRYWYKYVGWRGIFGLLVERCMAKLTKNHISVSDLTTRDLQAINVCGNIELITNGIELERINGIPIADKAYDIITACRFIKEKNIDMLIDAISIIKQSKPDINCMIIGDGPEQENLVEKTTKLDLANTIIFSGFFENSETVFSYFKSSGVFVLPSVREGFGIVVLEANACGLPVITVNHPQNAAKDLITNGENGFICEFNKDDLANKILMALKQKDQMKNRCKDFSKHYDWNNIINICETYYKKLTR